MTTPNIGPKEGLTQNIKYNGTETEYSVDIVGQNVVLHCNQGVHNHGSSKVKLINRIDYNWEFKYYFGNLVASHINGKLFAYAMKGKDGGMVRVCSQETNQRALIKNLKDDVKDVSFAFSREDILLGCVDSEGNVLVYQIHDQPASIQYTLLLHVFHRDDLGLSRSHINYRIIWCPYLASFEDEDTGEDPEKMFVLLNGSKAEVYNVAMIHTRYGSGPFDTDETYDGYIEINHNDELIDASFSSDGTAIAIASYAGYVKFYQLYMTEAEKLKCLHEWTPHDGKPLSSIIFIDNVLEYSSECWKFTITGANRNSEIKLWSCETWTCLQTITFLPDPTSLIPDLFFNMALDYKGQYVLISDINNRVLYVLNLKRNDAEQVVSVTTLSQFLLPAPFLSFQIIEALSKKIPYSLNNSTEDLYSEERDDSEDDTDVTVNCLKMLIIQPKKFQECNIIYQPEAILCSKSDCELVDQDLEVEKLPKLNDLQSSVNLLIQQQASKSQLNLMTPEDFNGTSSRPNSVRNSVSNESKEKVISDDSMENLIDFQRPQKDTFASGGSSPSREVQEILSLNNSTYSTQDFFDNLTKMDEEKPQKEFEPQSADLVFQENEMVWPKIPVVKDNEIVKDNQEDVTETNKTNLQAINFRISSLENTIREQNILMQKLHEDIKDLSHNRTSKEDFNKELECSMSKQHLQIAKMLENMVTMQKNKDREMQEHIVGNVCQVVTKSLGDKMQNTLSTELKHVVIPSVHNLMENYRKQVDAQYAQKIANTDMVLMENISKAMNNKALADALSSSVVKIVAPSLEKCYRDIIYSSLVPSWEKVCSQMFQQINETFTKGTKEYTASVESYMDRHRRVQEKGKDVVSMMQTVAEQLQSNSEAVSNSLINEIHKQFNVAFKSMQEKLTHTIRDVVSEQVRQGIKAEASVIEDSVLNAVRSRAVTPSPHLDTQASLVHIQQNLIKGNYDEAFQMALSAENLSFVMYACEKADLNTLFGDECMLQQSCLLALIQQLSMELHKNTELKLSYIRAAFLALSPENHTTKQFIPNVLKELLKQLHAFMTTNPPNKQLKEVKLLKMAVESMLNK